MVPSEPEFYERLCLLRTIPSLHYITDANVWFCHENLSLGTKYFLKLYFLITIQYLSSPSLRKTVVIAEIFENRDQKYCLYIIKCKI